LFIACCTRGGIGVGPGIRKMILSWNMVSLPPFV
jgi:hypothetical protein